MEKKINFRKLVKLIHFLFSSFSLSYDCLQLEAVTFLFSSLPDPHFSLLTIRAKIIKPKSSLPPPHPRQDHQGQVRPATAARMFKMKVRNAIIVENLGMEKMVKSCD